MVKKGLQLPKISALKGTKGIDRSTRKPPEGGGRKAWEEVPDKKDGEVGVVQETTSSPTDNKAPGKSEDKKQAKITSVPDIKSTETVKQGPEGVGQGANVTNKVNTPELQIAKKEPLASEATEHQLAVPLNSKEYEMYNKIVEKVNALGLPKKVRGTDIQRASIHLLSKMKPDTILKAHYEAMMPLKRSDQASNKTHPVSVSLQKREFHMFNKIISTVNNIGLPKKIRGTDIQRASIYLLIKMKPDRILKAHYKAMMP